MSVVTYNAIKVLPGKEYNWTRLYNALREMQITPITQDQEERFAVPGIRSMRHACMELATGFVLDSSRKSSFIPPSPETLAWGGFLGGETVVYTDADAEQEAVARVIALIKG